MGLLALIAIALAVTFAAKSSKATTTAPTTKPGALPGTVSPGGPVVPGMGGPPPTYAPAVACRPVTGVGASDRGPFTDGKGVVWCLTQSMGTPGTDVWQGYTQGYGLPERTVAAPDRTTLVQGIQFFASYNTPVAASGPGALPGGIPSVPSVPGVPGVPGTSVVSPCGVYPPLVGGWRPVCTAEHLLPTAVVPPSSRVELTIQEGARPIEDTTHMMQIEGVVTGGDPVNGYDVAFLGSVKATSDISLAAPLLGTTFKQVRPAFLHRIVPVDAPPGTEGLPPLPGLPGGIPGMA